MTSCSLPRVHSRAAVLAAEAELASLLRDALERDLSTMTEGSQGTTLEEDMRLLEQGGESLGPQMWWATVYRAERKKLLLRAIVLLDAYQRQVKRELELA